MPVSRSLSSAWPKLAVLFPYFSVLFGAFPRQKQDIKIFVTCKIFALYRRYATRHKSHFLLKRRRALYDPPPAQPHMQGYMTRNRAKSRVTPAKVPFFVGDGCAVAPLTPSHPRKTTSGAPVARTSSRSTCPRCRRSGLPQVVRCSCCAHSSCSC